MSRRQGGRRKARKHLLFWTFPVMIALILSLCIWLGVDAVMGKARPLLDKVLAMVTIV